MESYKDGEGPDKKTKLPGIQQNDREDLQVN